MKRRRLLATLIAGGTTGLAGCGYAYGGGDLRDETTVRPIGLVRGEPMYAVTDNTIVAARNGRTHDHDRSEFREATLLVVADPDGTERWSFTHWGHTGAVAFGNSIYLLEMDGRVVAVDTVTVEDDRGVERSEPRALWEVELASPLPPIAADAGSAYVQTRDRVAAVRDGSVAWELDVSGRVETLLPIADGLLVQTRGSIAFASDGRERWRYGGASAVGFGGDRVFVADGRRIESLDPRDGDVLWTHRLDARIRRLRFDGGTLYALADGRVVAIDVEADEVVWRTTDSVRVSDQFVPSSEGVYDVSDGCEVFAVDSEGVRWTRQVDVGDCTVVEGWLDGEAVVLLFASGDLLSLQRTDQDPGLLR